MESTLLASLSASLSETGPHNLSDDARLCILRLAQRMVEELGTIPEWDAAASEDDRCSIDRRRDDAARAVARYILQSLDVDGMGACRLCRS